MNSFTVGLGRGVCSVAEATLGYASSCSGAGSLSIIGSLTGFMVLMVAGGWVLMRRV